jgi:hypothetical protein
VVVHLVKPVVPELPVVLVNNGLTQVITLVGVVPVDDLKLLQAAQLVG